MSLHQFADLHCTPASLGKACSDLIKHRRFFLIQNSMPTQVLDKDGEIESCQSSSSTWKWIRIQ